jgi:hypothetical protein
VPIIGVPTAVHIGRLMLAPVAGVVILVLLSLKIGYLALVLLPLPWLEIARLSIAWRRARRLTRSLP